MSPKSRQDRALSIKKIFKRTDAVADQGDPGEIIRLREENAQLRGQIKKDWTREFDRGYIEGLKRAWSLVEAAEGRPGKRQLAEVLQGAIAKAEGREEG